MREIGKIRDLMSAVLQPKTDVSSFCIEELSALFHQCFEEEFNTRLVKGEDEPIYLPANDEVSFHQVVFAHGYFASALHEIAHWCIAGEKRREQEDYGYWYCPDGRDESQQKAFESVEIKPQALEWAFSLAAGKPFRVSTDNLNGAEPDVEGFTNAVYAQLCDYVVSDTFPPRGKTFIEALCTFYGTQPLSETYLNESVA